MRRTPSPLWIAHQRHGEPYHVGNSLRGLRRTHRRRINGQDVDGNISADGTPCATHWLRPLAHDQFRDPLRRIPKHAAMSSLTDRQIRRLIAPRGYRIQPMKKVIRRAARLGLTICYEVKDDKRFATPGPYAYLKKWADRYGASMVIMSQPFGGRGFDRLAMAQKFGFDTLLLTRGPVPAKYWPVLTYAKGPREHMDGKPASVTWLGPGSPHGGSVTLH